nr:MAG TPA: hypothetical protein [Caudoviricetes sp.]
MYTYHLNTFFFDFCAFRTFGNITNTKEAKRA